MKPPHLPNETCSIKQHQQISRIKLLLVTVFFALLAGGTGAIIVLGWIWPNTEIGSTWIVAQNRRTENETSLENSVMSEVKEKIYNVYGSADTLGESGVLLENKLGEAASVSSDGWLVMYLSDSTKISSVKKWQVSGSGGTIFSVTDYRFDPFTDLVYLKVTPVNEKSNDLTQFKVIGFYRDAINNLDVYVLNGQTWQNEYLSGDYKFISSLAHPESVANRGYTVSGELAVGKPLVNNRGWLVGFVTKNNLVLTASNIENTLSQVLSGQKIKYPSLGSLGRFTEEQPIAIDGEMIGGFIVEKIWQSKTLLRKNDIILKVNDRAASDSSVFYDFSADTRSVKIWRNGKILDISVQPSFITENDFNKI